MNIKFKVFFLAFVLCSIAACREAADLPGSKNGLAESRLKILTTIPPLFSFTANIVGEHAEVSNLIPSGVGPHEYSFSPADMKKIAEADIIIRNSVNLETWLDSVIVSAGKEGLIVVDTSSGVEIINNNPHIWLSPMRARLQVRNIRDALIGRSPDLEEVFARNAGNYIRRLEFLDGYIRDEIRTWRNKKIVAFHPAFLYFTL
jgi:zinc/manganese transport system substrate-binding protein